MRAIYLLGNEAELWYICLETRLLDFIYFLMSICERKNPETLSIILSLIQ